MSTAENLTIARDEAAEKAPAMTKLEMAQKMLADQQLIREAIQNGIPLTELTKTHGLKFATLPTVEN